MAERIKQYIIDGVIPTRMNPIGISRTVDPHPYDAEIEYLESTGTQYIDTDILMYDSYSFGVTFEALNVIDGRWILFFGWRNSNQYQLNYNLSNTKIGSFAWDINYNGTTSQPAYSNTWYDVECNSNGNNRELIVNGDVLKSWTANAQHKNTLNAYLFASNINGKAEQRGQKNRVSKAWIKDETGNLVRDFISVRKGSVGYLYDKVSSQLFGNAGTGDFILGPDK